MNIYLCSTVRNLLFSLLRALSEKEKASRIYMICDQQNVDKESYNLSSLPGNIKVVFIERKMIKSILVRQKWGYLIRAAAVLNLKVSVSINNKVRKLLFSAIIPSKEEELLNDEAQLYLFNDKNKIARLFRLSFSEYRIIEDGLSNYKATEPNIFERVKSYFLFQKKKMIYLGSDSRCKDIFLLKPNLAPEEIKHKCRSINFVLPDFISAYCFPFFNFTPLNKSYRNIIATQPISVENYSNSGVDLVVYEKIFSYLKIRGEQFALKVHPREDINKYKEHFPDVELIESKIPLELLLLKSKEKVNIISIYSAAGMGFESFSNRITLIKDNEVKIIGKILTSWIESDASIELRVQETLANN